VAPLLAKGFGVATLYYGDIDPDFPGGVPLVWRALYLKAGETRTGLPANGARFRRGPGPEPLPWITSDRSGREMPSALPSRCLAAGKDRAVGGRPGHALRHGHSQLFREGGAALSRRNYGETIAAPDRTLALSLPFCANYRKYAEHADRLPGGRAHAGGP